MVPTGTFGMSQLGLNVCRRSSIRGETLLAAPAPPQVAVAVVDTTFGPLTPTICAKKSRCVAW